MFLKCSYGYKIRIMESYYGVSLSANSMASEDYCLSNYADLNAQNDCKSQAPHFQRTCNGRQTCSIDFFPNSLKECNANSQYLSVIYECVPGKPKKLNKKKKIKTYKNKIS